VRIGLVLPDGEEAAGAALADAHGLFGVLVRPDRPGTEMVRAAEVAAATRDTRILVWTVFGREHPITLAEETAVVDNISGGRLAVVADPGGLPADEAGEDLQILRRGWSGRPVRHHGPRWKVPGGTHDGVPDAVTVTPKPAQLDLPLWLAGDFADPPGLPALLPGPDALPRLVTDPVAVDGGALVAPALTGISGVLEEDRDTVTRWAGAGASHLLLVPPAGVDLAALVSMVSRYLIPEVATPHFPRILIDSPPPLPWVVS
jgi:hypothetical protein